MDEITNNSLINLSHIQKRKKNEYYSTKPVH